jgi:hypothetical protein
MLAVETFKDRKMAENVQQYPGPVVFGEPCSEPTANIAVGQR